jgi:Tol biopolymer transport system component
MKNLKLIGFVCGIYLIAVLSCNQEDNGSDGNDCPWFDIVPTSPYNDPIWHPRGEIIGFNHIPIKEIRYTYGFDCPRQATYIYELDSIGFWLVNADGTNQRRVLPFTLTTPAWSPCGQWIAFSHGAQICIMPFDGERFDTTAVQQLTWEGRNFYPTWSPDGSRVAYNRSICEGPNTCGIWIAEISLNDNYFIHTYGNFPTWHPLQDSLVFRTRSVIQGSVLGDSLWLYSIALDTKVLLLNISHPNYDNRHFRYSPDGTKIGFTSAYWAEGINLYTISSKGENMLRLTDEGCVGFSWSPEGRIVYVNFNYYRIDETKGTLWTMDADGGNKEPLTFNTLTKIQ